MGHSTIEAGDGRAAVLTNVDDTLFGSGYIGWGSAPRLAVVNEAAGVIDADVASWTLKMRADRPSTNAGLMEATNGGTLSIFDTSVDNVGGKIEATGGGLVYINDLADISGGSIYAGAGSTVYEFGNSTVSGAVLSTAQTGVLSLEFNCTVTTTGVVVNAGTTELGMGGGSGSTMIIDKDVTLTGAGTISLGASTIEGASSASVLTNIDNTIAGTGELGSGHMDLINRAAGVIEADGAPFTIDTGDRTITNGGIIEAGTRSQCFRAGSGNLDRGISGVSA
jgi:hypothetical protein